MENDIIDSLNDLGYEGPLTDEVAFSKAIEGGPKSLEYTKLVHILAEEIKKLCNLEETVNIMNDPDESSSFLLELSSFLKELGCPYKKLITGHMSSRLQSKEDKILLLDYLVSELMAARMVSVDCPKEKQAGMNIVMQESPTAKDLKEILISLKFNKPPPNITPEILFSKLEAKLKETIQKEGEKLVGKPLYNKALTEKDWKQLENTFTELFEEYRLRRETLITRLECTIQSFEWSDRLKSKKDQIQSTYRPKREQLKLKPDVKLSDFLAARTSLLQIEKTSSASVRKNTQSEVNKVLIGRVPDRGGRPNEQQPPPPEMPSWQQRTAGPQGGRGGGRGDSRGRGDRGRGGRVQGGYNQGPGDQRPQTSPGFNQQRNYQTYEVPPGGYQQNQGYQNNYNQGYDSMGSYNQRPYNNQGATEDQDGDIEEVENIEDIIDLRDSIPQSENLCSESNYQKEEIIIDVPEESPHNNVSEEVLTKDKSTINKEEENQALESSFNTEAEPTVKISESENIVLEDDPLLFNPFAMELRTEYSEPIISLAEKCSTIINQDLSSNVTINADTNLKQPIENHSSLSKSARRKMKRKLKAQDEAAKTYVQASCSKQLPQTIHLSDSILHQATELESVIRTKKRFRGKRAGRLCAEKQSKANKRYQTLNIQPIVDSKRPKTCDDRSPAICDHRPKTCDDKDRKICDDKSATTCDDNRSTIGPSSQNVCENGDDLRRAVMTEPYMYLSKDETNKIQKTLEELLDMDGASSKPISRLPCFRGRPIHTDGVLKLWCDDEFSLDWLRKRLSSVPCPRADCKLTVKPLSEIPQTVKAGIFIPQYSGQDIKTIKRFMKEQNSWYNVDTWSFYALERQDRKNGAFVSLSIPLEDVSRILNRGKRVSYKLGSVYVLFRDSRIHKAKKLYRNVL